MTLYVDGQGQVRCLYQETVDLTTLGRCQIQRASQVEPDEHGRWWADLSLVQGPRLGPYASRSQALAAEQAWLEPRLLEVCLPG